MPARPIGDATTGRALGTSKVDRKRLLGAHKDSQIARFAKERLWK